jgi:hypothetical protein
VIYDGFGFHDQIYWTLNTLIQHFTNHYLRLDTLEFWPHYTNPLLQLNYSDFQMNCQLSLSLTLRPTVSPPVCLRIKHPSGAYDQIFIIVWQLPVCWFGAPSLTRGRVCRLQLQLALASAVIFGSESRRTLAKFYCLRFDTSLFVASYDSQGHGGGIRLRLHTGQLSVIGNLSLYSPGSDLTENTSTV